jgi:hypothetical protein
MNTIIWSYERSGQNKDIKNDLITKTEMKEVTQNKMIQLDSGRHQEEMKELASN